MVNETTDQPVAMDTQLASNSHYITTHQDSTSTPSVSASTPLIKQKREREVAVEKEDKTGILKKEKLKLEIEFFKLRNRNMELQNIKLVQQINSIAPAQVLYFDNNAQAQ